MPSGSSTQHSSPYAKRGNIFRTFPFEIYQFSLSCSIANEEKHKAEFGTLAIPSALVLTRPSFVVAALRRHFVGKCLLGRESKSKF